MLSKHCWKLAWYLGELLELRVQTTRGAGHAISRASSGECTVLDLCANSDPSFAERSVRIYFGFLNHDMVVRI
jgi:hypothetical protein